MGDNRAWMYDQWDKPPGFCLRQQFTDGLEGFIEFAAANTPSPGFLRCPCSICKNKKFKEEDEVKHHIMRKGFMPNYYTWTCHGETMAVVVDNRERVDVEVNPNQHTRGENNFVDMIYDVAGPSLRAQINEASESEEPNPKAKAFYELLKKAAKPISEGSLDSILSITSKALTLKSKHNGSQQMFNDMMDVFRPNMAGGDDLPRNFYQAKKLVGALGLPHERIDVCLNGCMLYWKEHSNLIECKYCKHPRWKTKTRKDKTRSQNNRGKKVPFKRLHYLPLIPRLQRLYASNETAKHMTWHAERASESGTMCHPSDSEAWKDFDARWKEFSSDPRNVRLGLCTDGFQPFGNTGKKFSCWPVLVTPYNLPPWMCMKKPVIFLTLLAPGPENPKHKIHIYLQPIIEELKQLWSEGIETFDVYKKQNFMMKAALMWTISDFPAYAMLSGWSTAGKLACPYCMDKTDGFRLENGRKVFFFDSHRKFLPIDHKYRSNKRNFRKNITITAPPPQRLSSEQVWEQVKHLPKMVDEGGSTPTLVGKGESHNWVKQSIFWELPYWKTNMIRHNLDAMHIIRNVFCNVFYTVMDVKGKTKDNGASRLDIKKICKRPELHIPDGSQKKPLARYELDKAKKQVVLQWVKDLRFPDGYCSNLSRCVDLNASTMGCKASLIACRSVVTEMLKKGGSGFKGISKGNGFSSSHAPVVPSSSNHSIPVNSKTPLSTNSHSQHGLDSFPSVEGTPPPTSGMQRISPTGSPTGSPTDSLEDATSLPTHTPSSQSSSDNTLWVECGHFMPFDQKPVSIIGTIVKEKYDIFFPTFSAVPPDVKQQMWAEFKKNFTIPEECEGDVKRLFRQKAGNFIRGNMWQAKRLYMTTEERADWLAPTMWTKAIAHWQSKGFKKKSKANKANRNRINSKGLPVGKHTGGRRSTHDWRMTMERDFKRKVLGAELFATLHTKRKEKKLVDVVAESVQERFTQAIPEIMSYFGKGEEIPKELFDKADTTFVNCVRDEVKGRIYGLGNLTEEYSTGTSPHPSFLSHGKVAKLTEQLTQLTTENVGLHEEIVVLREKASESERMAAGLDAEIKRILAEQEKHAEEMRADQERRDAKIRDELRAEQEQKEAQMMKMFAEKEEKDAARDADNAYIKQMLEQFKAAGFSVAPKQ